MGMLLTWLSPTTRRHTASERITRCLLGGALSRLTTNEKVARRKLSLLALAKGLALQSISVSAGGVRSNVTACSPSTILEKTHRGQTIELHDEQILPTRVRQ